MPAFFEMTDSQKAEAIREPHKVRCPACFWWEQTHETEPSGRRRGLCSLNPKTVVKFSSERCRYWEGIQ